MMFGTRRVFVGVAEWDSGELLVGLAHLREADHDRMQIYERNGGPSVTMWRLCLYSN
jgi:hypothetical protein